MFANFCTSIFCLLIPERGTNGGGCFVYCLLHISFYEKETKSLIQQSELIAQRDPRNVPEFEQRYTHNALSYIDIYKWLLCDSDTSKLLPRKYAVKGHILQIFPSPLFMLKYISEDRCAYVVGKKQFNPQNLLLNLFVGYLRRVRNCPCISL